MMRLLLMGLATLALTGGSAVGAVQPNDPVWAEQLGARQIGLPQVWETTTGDPGVVIATVDTGANRIPDLEGALVPGYDFVDNDFEPQDTHAGGHGSRVASVIAARGNNEIGMAGYCWGCRVMPIRVSANGSASPARIAAGIRYAVDQGARIINVSLSHAGSPDAAEAAAVAVRDLARRDRGRVGGERRHRGAPVPGGVSRRARRRGDRRSRRPLLLVELWALGEPDGSRLPDGHRLATPPGTICGTSFTPAVVAAVAGLILSKQSETHREPGRRGAGRDRPAGQGRRLRPGRSGRRVPLARPRSERRRRRSAAADRSPAGDAAAA